MDKIQCVKRTYFLNMDNKKENKRCNVEEDDDDDNKKNFKDIFNEELSKQK